MRAIEYPPPLDLPSVCSIEGYAGDLLPVSAAVGKERVGGYCCDTDLVQSPVNINLTEVFNNILPTPLITYNFDEAPKTYTMVKTGVDQGNKYY